MVLDRHSSNTSSSHSIKVEVVDILELMLIPSRAVIRDHTHIHNRVKEGGDDFEKYDVDIHRLKFVLSFFFSVNTSFFFLFSPSIIVGH